MNKVLKLQRVGLITPTVVEYEGKVLATNHLDIESLCNLWRGHFGFYTTEKVDLAMTKKQFSSIQQKTLSSVKSVYELFYERNFIPREFEANEEHTEWGMYRNKELEKLEAENAALRERLEKAKKEIDEYQNKIEYGKLVEPIWFLSFMNDLPCYGRVIGYQEDSGFVIECTDCMISAKEIYFSEMVRADRKR